MNNLKKWLLVGAAGLGFLGVGLGLYNLSKPEKSIIPDKAVQTVQTRQIENTNQTNNYPELSDICNQYLTQIAKELDLRYVDEILRASDITGEDSESLLGLIKTEHDGFDFAEISPAGAIGPFSITELAYKEIQRVYDLDQYKIPEVSIQIQDVLSEYGIDIEKSWNELMEEWELDKNSFDFQKKLFGLGVAYMLINKIKFINYFANYENANPSKSSRPISFPFETTQYGPITEKQINELVLIAHHNDYAQVRDAFKAAKTLDPFVVAHNLKGEASKKYFPEIAHHRAIYKQIMPDILKLNQP